MDDFIGFYLVITPLVILFSARALAVSRKHRRAPLISEVLLRLPEVDENDKRWLLAAKRFLVAWSFVFLVLWLHEDDYHKSYGDSVIAIIGLSIFHAAFINHILRAILFNSTTRPEGASAKQENAEYFKSFSVFPGFGNLFSSLISLSMVVIVILIFLFVFSSFLFVGG